MIESGYYPAGTEHDPNAPWNEKKYEPQAFPCEVAVTLRKKNVDVYTDQYEEGYEKDEDGLGGYWSEPLPDVDWEEEYKNSNLTIPELLKELKTMAEDILACGDELVRISKNKGRLKAIVEACDGWEVEELEVTTE